MNTTTIEERYAENARLLTFNQAAAALGLPVWKLRRAAKAGLFPTYHVLNTRRLVRLSEVVAAIDATREGGPIDG